MISSKFFVEQFYAHSFINAVVIADARAMEIDQILGAIKNGWVKPVWADAMI
ncbi:hypothetical protein GWN65_02555 [Candidatus Bathyarchaeota archaeon]|nr:hypothetical protein [Candidatus Bathyarchaeota archaeon]NIV43904.1 hypothetical protein [Candidatus Bathyarchaeota archaeon]NIW10156.1 hypothetical protein [Gammaproteobacteria bacterium]